MKAQVMVVDLLFFSLVVIIVIYLIVTCCIDLSTQNKIAEKEIKELEDLLFIEDIISNCEYFAYSPIHRTSVCYKNNLDVKITETLLQELNYYNICKIEINNKIIHHQNKAIKKTIERGIVENETFKIAKFSFC